VKPTLVATLAALLLLCSSLFAQELSNRPAEVPKAAGKAPNSNAIYQQLRAIGPTGDSIDVQNVVLKRDIATFTFEKGTIQFTPPVNGMITGALFSGTGKLTLEPPSLGERMMLMKLTKGLPYEEHFDSVVLRFTDDTAKELRAAAGVSPSSAKLSSTDFDRVRDALKKDMYYNLSAHMMSDVLMGKGENFAAFIDGKNYSHKQAFFIDPDDAEPVSLVLWDAEEGGNYISEGLLSEIQTGKTRMNAVYEPFRVENYALNTKIEKSGRLSGDAVPTIIAQRPIQAVHFALFGKLRVDSVTLDDGQPLDFVQEDEKYDSAFYILLPKKRETGEKFRLRITYAGKDAVENAGGGNYFPVVRQTWYPNASFGRYSTYDLTFSIPKKHTMAATGTLLHQADEGDWNVSTWKSDAPQAVAGFNFGRFKTQQVKLEKEGYLITGYVNDDVPDNVKALLGVASEGVGAAFGTMSTVPMLKRNVAEAQASMQIYDSLFGPSPYKSLAVTQQTACSFGQAWPGLVYLPICAFYDSTVRHGLGLSDDRGYWQVVGPHEVAHQWWGHKVGFEGGRDQWMSEGFAEFSASIFVQRVYDNKKFSKFWQDELDLLTEKNRQGVRPIDVGPVTMGYRLALSKTGTNVPRYLIYPKGAYILHMIRMMMYDQRNGGDAAFYGMMRDFADTYANKTASTEDFKAMVEKHMKPSMNETKDGKMDWFFNEYVYGVGLPRYKFEHSFSDAGPGKVKMHVRLTQSEVGKDFVMPVPLYVELANGNVARLGSINMTGNSTFEQDIELPMPQPPKRAMVNYFYDVLALTN
jgi:hypothetical protein